MENQDDTLALHKVAVEIAETMEVPDEQNGTSARLPPKVVLDWKRKLPSLRDDKLLFIHLAVIGSRLKGKGLMIVGEELMGLARIGLLDSELEKSIKGIDAARGAGESLKKGDQDARAARGALKQSTATGVGLRKGPAAKGPHNRL